MRFWKQPGPSLFYVTTQLFLVFFMLFNTLLYIYYYWYYYWYLYIDIIGKKARKRHLFKSNTDVFFSFSIGCLCVLHLKQSLKETVVNLIPLSLFSMYQKDDVSFFFYLRPTVETSEDWHPVAYLIGFPSNVFFSFVNDVDVDTGKEKDISWKLSYRNGASSIWVRITRWFSRESVLY